MRSWAEGGMHAALERQGAAERSLRRWRRTFPQGLPGPSDAYEAGFLAGVRWTERRARAWGQEVRGAGSPRASEGRAMNAGTKCDHCGDVITGKGKRFCSAKCMRAWGRKVAKLRREYPEARHSYPAEWDDEGCEPGGADR